MIEDIKVWFLLKMRVVENAINAMMSMVSHTHHQASQEDNEQRAKEMRENADRLARDAEELRKNMEQGLREDRHPPTRERRSEERKE